MGGNIVKQILKQKSAIDLTKRFASISIIVAILFATVPLSTLAAESKAVPNVNAAVGMDNAKNHGLWYKTQILPAQRKAAAANFKTTYSANRDKTQILPAKNEAVAANSKTTYLANQAVYGNSVMNPGGVPHYFGPDPNYANTPIIHSDNTEIRRRAARPGSY